LDRKAFFPHPGGERSEKKKSCEKTHYQQKQGEQKEKMKGKAEVQERPVISMTES